MAYRFLADVVLVLHLGFVLFVVLGALLVFRWPRLKWLHLPAAVWGAVIELAGWYCPLTPLENELRRLGGQRGYSGGFIERYVTALLYPGELPRMVHVALGLLVIAINAAIYWRLFRQSRKGSGTPTEKRRP
jgi:hypothetical protein